MSAKILLIEPDRRLGKIYQSALSDDGHEVELHSSAESALKFLDETVPDLIILEPQLVSHGGIELLYELRSYRDWQLIPVIIHSLIPTHVLELMSAALKQLGVDIHFYKPKTSLQQLVNASSDLLVAADSKI